MVIASRPEARASRNIRGETRFLSTSPTARLRSDSLQSLGSSSPPSALTTRRSRPGLDFGAATAATAAEPAARKRRRSIIVHLLRGDRPVVRAPVFAAALHNHHDAAQISEALPRIAGEDDEIGEL